MSPVELIKLGGAHREHGAALDHLHIDTHLEHIAGRCHDHIGLPGVCQHLAHLVTGAGLDTRLVDRAGDQVGCAEGKCSRGRSRRRNAATQTNSQGPRITILFLAGIFLRLDRREERHRRTVIRVTAGVRLNRHILGHRNFSCHLGLLGSQITGGNQLLQKTLRWRGKKFRRHFFARDLGNNVIGCNDIALFIT